MLNEIWKTMSNDLGALKMQFNIQWNPNVENEFFDLIRPIIGCSSYSHGPTAKRRPVQLDEFDLRYLRLLTISSVFNAFKYSICFPFMQIELEQKSNPTIKSRCSLFVYVFGDFWWGASFFLLYELISTLNGLHVTESWKCTANNRFIKWP